MTEPFTAKRKKLRCSSELTDEQLSRVIRKAADLIEGEIDVLHMSNCGQFIPNADWTVWAECINRDQGWPLGSERIELTNEHLTDAIKLAEKPGNPSYGPTDYESKFVK